MRYTQSQIRNLLGVPVETFRHWRGAIPALARHKGHGPTFTPGDVIALAILSDLVRDFGIRVSAIAPRIDELFEICNARSWLALEPCVVLIHANAVRIARADNPRHDVADRAVLAIPCGPIVDRLRSSLTAAEADDPQGRLQFPPATVAVKAR